MVEAGKYEYSVVQHNRGGHHEDPISRNKLYNREFQEASTPRSNLTTDIVYCSFKPLQALYKSHLCVAIFLVMLYLLLYSQQRTQLKSNRAYSPRSYMQRLIVNVIFAVYVGIVKRGGNSY